MAMQLQRHQQVAAEEDASAVAAAIPSAVRRRLANVLSHLAAAKASGGGSGANCARSVGHARCSGEGAAAVDIEDLGSGCKPLASRRHSGDYYDDDEATLFNPRLYEQTQRPLLDASTLPSHVYSSRKWFDREMERVFMPSWFIVGREDELQEPGSYIAVDTEFGGPVAVCRGTDGRLHAFANVCCHRGAKVMPDGKGKAPKVGLICPYHAWTYEFDGALKWAPGMDETNEFEVEGVRLAPVRSDTFHGFIFVCHAAESRPLAEVLGDLPEKLSVWFGPEGQVKDMVCVARREYDVDCNWKFLMENTCETYHTSVVHKGSLGPMKSRPMEPHVGDWDAVRVPSSRSVVPLPTDFEGESFPLPAFTDQTAFVNLFPSLQINVTWDCIWWMCLVPTGPTSTKIQMGFCFPKVTQRLERFPSVLERYLHRWRVAVEEDNAISLNQQRGVRSSRRVPGRFGQLEFGTHNFNNWLLSRMIDGQVWNPGQRVFVGNTAWSNDDQRMLTLAENLAATAVSAAGPRPLSVLTEGAAVCVTGATGFIGLHLVESLLSRGCRVTAAVRDAADERKMAPLLALQRGASATGGTLELVGGCDVLCPGSFDRAVAGCEVCFHLASPFWMDDRITDPHAQLIVPAEQGTLTVLRSCAQAGKGLRRVVVTSSVAAVMNLGGNASWPADFHYTEQHWNESSAPLNGVFPEPRNAHAYRWSKTLAERAAWAFVEAEKPSFDVVCIHPPMVLGPNTQRLTSAGDINQSSLIIFKMLAGQAPHVNPGSAGFVDVRDVAKAHVLAAETQAAGGQRFLCSGTSQTWLHVAALLRELFPGRPVPTACADGSTQQPCVLFDSGKIRRELGMEFIPLSETLREQGEAFIRAGLLPALP